MEKAILNAEKLNRHFGVVSRALRGKQEAYDGMQSLEEIAIQFNLWRMENEKLRVEINTLRIKVE